MGLDDEDDDRESEYNIRVTQHDENEETIQDELDSPSDEDVDGKDHETKFLISSLK